MTETKTDPKLLERLLRAARATMSPEAQRKQKISFIMGSLGDKSTITREHVEHELDRMEGKAA